MKQLPILFLLLLTFSFADAQVKKDSVAEKYASTIQASDLSQYLHVIASDSLAGRETGEPGQKKAAAYLASKFNEFGLQPGAKKPDGASSYFQEFELLRRAWDDVYIKVDDQKKVFLNDFFVYGDLNVPKEIKTEAVFGGYGIETNNYTDYIERDCKKEKALDVKGKVVIIFNWEPIYMGKSLITGDSNVSSWANDWRKKVELAKSKGAAAVFLVVGNSQKDFNVRLGQLKEHIAKPTLGFTYKERPSAFFIPIDLAAQILKTTSDRLLKELDRITRYSCERQDVLSRRLKLNPKPGKPLKGKVAFKCSVKESKFVTENVLGYIEGTDKKDELIVLTAHYDHLGSENGKICYGADDDGSGTAALLEIAQAFAKAKQEGHGPRRSILIMPVTAEEKGLMGSEYYSDHPVYPLEKTVADLNIDMIGRLDASHKTDTNYVYIIGSNRLSTELHEISEEVNKTYLNIHLDYKYNSFNDPNRFYFRSDHYNFAKHRIPVIFYFNGTHEDYHKPTDTVDKIIFPKVEKITRLVFLTAWELAMMEKRIEVNVKEE